MTDTRYDRLRNKLSNEFSRARTISPELAAGEQKTLLSLDDHSETFAIPARFEKFGPFNSLYVRNFGSADVRVYLNQERTTFTDVPSATNQAIPVLDRIPARYVRYLRVENLDGATAVDAGDLQIYVGTEIDGVEMDLLEMSGELDV